MIKSAREKNIIQRLAGFLEIVMLKFLPFLYPTQSVYIPGRQNLGAILAKCTLLGWAHTLMSFWTQNNVSEQWRKHTDCILFSLEPSASSLFPSLGAPSWLLGHTSIRNPKCPGSKSSFQIQWSRTPKSGTLCVVCPSCPGFLFLISFSGDL